MARRSGRGRYMRDRADRRRMGRDKSYQMDYRYGRPEYDYRGDSARGRDRHYREEEYMGDERPRQSYRDYEYDMRRRDYSDDDYEEEYREDLEKWIKKLKAFDRFNVPKEQVISKAEDMKVDFKDYDEEEFYAIYLMHISDYPTIANEPHTYISMAKSWLEDKDLKIDPSEKVCKYLYEIVMADED